MSKHYLNSASIFLLCFASAFLWPVIAIIVSSYIPRSITEYLFFWPQTSLPYAFLVSQEHLNIPIFSEVIGILLNIIQWFFITAIFSFATIKIKNKKYIIAWSFVIIAIVPIITIWATSTMGYIIQSDAP